MRPAATFWNLNLCTPFIVLPQPVYTAIQASYVYLSIFDIACTDWSFRKKKKKIYIYSVSYMYLLNTQFRSVMKLTAKFSGVPLLFQNQRSVQPRGRSEVTSTISPWILRHKVQLLVIVSITNFETKKSFDYLFWAKKSVVFCISCKTIGNIKEAIEAHVTDIRIVKSSNYKTLKLDACN